MAQFDVHTYPGGGLEVPYLLDVQSDFLSRMRARVVVPLVPMEVYGKPIRHLNPVFEIRGEPHVMATLDLGAIPLKDLGPAMQSLSSNRDEIVRALDTIVQGI